MKKKYKYIHFEKWHNNMGWNIVNNKSSETLGCISEYKPWHQYCFYPTKVFSTVYSAGCLMDIADFLNQVNGVVKDKK